MTPRLTAYLAVAIWHVSLLQLLGDESHWLSSLVPMVIVSAALSLPGRTLAVASYAAASALWSAWCWRTLGAAFRIIEPLRVIEWFAGEILQKTGYVTSTCALLFVIHGLHSRCSIDRTARAASISGAWLAANAALMVAVEFYYLPDDSLLLAARTVGFVSLVVLGAAVMSLERRWDRERSRWLSDVVSGRVPGWRVNMLDGSNHHDHLPVFRDRDRDRCDGALGRVLEEGSPYRGNVEYMALVPTPADVE